MTPSSALRRSVGMPEDPTVEISARKPRWRPPVPWTPEWLFDATVLALGALKVWVLALWLAGSGLQDLFAGGAGALVSLGRLTGLLASALMLDQVLLMARIPYVERAVGQDRIVRWHRLVGMSSFGLMMAHIVFITAGYAGGLLGFVPTFVDQVLNAPGMLLALAGTLAICGVVGTSLQRARAKLKYESWHLLHLYAYLGTFLALPHQLWTGAEFERSTAQTAAWWLVWFAAIGCTLGFRVAVPLYRSLRHDLRVESVTPAGANAVTVRMTGRHLPSLAVQAGQFFNWRFLGGIEGLRANPYSLSAAPDGKAMEITAAGVGDGSSRLASLAPGTRVVFEGPYGRMHPGRQGTERAVLIGCGVGIAPLKAVAEALAGTVTDMRLIYRCRSEEDAPLLGALRALSRRGHPELTLLTGPRSRGRGSWLPAGYQQRSSTKALVGIAPKLAESDVYVCGPTSWVEAVVASCRDAGVPRERIHAEHFTY